MRVAIYIRVSTNNQVQQQTIERQLERLSTYMQSQSWPLPAEHIFRDDGFSGASFKRPALEQLRTQVRARAFDRVLLTAPDRLARNYVHQVLLIDEFAQAGCQVEFLDRPMSDDPHDQLLLQIRGAVAEYERTLITERTRRGRLAKIQAGLLLPWIQPPYGYVVDPEHPRDPARIQHDPVAASVVRELFALYIEERTTLRGLSLHLYQRQIPSPTSKARWGLATLQGILRNPVYTGKVYTGRWQYRAPQVRRSATHPLGRSHDSARPVDHTEWTLVAQIPALVSDEDFARVQAKLVQTQQRAARNNTAHAYLLRALVSCGKCQRACVGVTRRKYQYYLCSGKWHPIHSGQEEPCPARHIPVAQLDELVWQDLCAILRDPQQITAALERLQGGDWLPQELQMRGENLRKGQRSLEQQVERLTEAYLATVIGLEEYQRRRREVEQKLQGLGEQEAQLRHQALRHQEVAGLVANIEEFCGRVAQGLAMADFAQKRQLVELLIDRVVVTDEEVEIRYAIPTSPRGEQVRFYQLRTDYFDAPHMVDPDNRQIPQQVRVNGRLGGAFTQMGSRINGGQPHIGHVTSDRFPIDRLAFAGQLGGNPARAVERRGGIDFVNAMFERHLLRRWRGRLIVETGAAQPQQCRLVFERKVRVGAIHQGQAVSPTQFAGQLFFQPCQLRGQLADLSVEIMDLLVMGRLERRLVRGGLAGE